MDEKIKLKLISKAKNYSIDGYGKVEKVDKNGNITREVEVSKKLGLQLLRSKDFEKVKEKTPEPKKEFKTSGGK